MRLQINGALAAFLIATVASAPAFGVEIVELKSGRVIEANKTELRGDKLYVELHLPGKNQLVGYTIAVHKVIPEFIFYVRLEKLSSDKPEAHKDLGDWARKQGLFRHALKAYEIAGAADADFMATFGELTEKLHEEEATWTFDEAYRLFKLNDVKEARLRVERVLEDFKDTKEVGRAKELLNIIKEREQFLSEQRRQEEVAKRARKHKRAMDKQIDRVRKADRQVSRVRLKYIADAKRRLQWAAYAYRKAAMEFSELLLVVEVDELRVMLRGLLTDLDDRMVRTFLKLGDIRLISGDGPGALDAAHEVLSIIPSHEGAKGLRERVLDGESRADVRGDLRSYSFPSYVRNRYLIPYAGNFARRYYGRRTLRIGLGGSRRIGTGVRFHFSYHR